LQNLTLPPPRIEAAPLAEAFYQRLMRCYRQERRSAEAIAVYRRLRQTLSVTLGVAPSPASEALYRALISSEAATRERLLSLPSSLAAPSCFQFVCNL